MTKTMSISFTDFFYDTYLEGVKTNNKSKYIERLAILGFESTLGTEEGLKKKFIELKKENEKLLEELNDLKRKYAKYNIDKVEEKRKIKEEKEEHERDVALVRSIIKSGVLNEEEY